MMDKKNLKHSFVICAYKESPFLEECIVSLKKQTVESNIIMITSTPNDYIRNTAKKYEIELFINHGENGIVQDWNFGYAQCKTPYITIAHQDDIYFPDYAEHAMRYIEKSKHPLIYFSNYCEIRRGKRVEYNKLLKIKRLLIFPLRFRIFQKSRFARRRALSLGNCICCPAVTFVKKNLPNPIFTVRFRSNEDWEAWERLSKIKGSFIYDTSIEMGHRIHEGSETSAIIGDSKRREEDYSMFRKFWPKWIALFLVKVYSKSEESNRLD